ncbi:MAG: hypothetical protein ACM3S5_05050 [Rhodospirillales bacterium]
MTRHAAALALMALCVSVQPARRQSAATLNLSRDEYIDRVHAAWMGQVLGMLMGYQFEHKQGAVAPVDRLPEIFRGQRLDFVPLDDDWYYEIVALRAFEKHGIGLTVRQLGEQWLENKAGFWSCSRETLRLLERGIQAPDTGHPRYNRSWFTIGAQLSAVLRLSGTPRLYLEVSAEPGKAWHLEVFAGNDRIASQRIVGARGERAWHQIQVDLKQYAGRDTQLRVYQRTLVGGRLPSKAFWRRIEVR